MKRIISLIFIGVFSACLIMVNFFNHFFAEQSLKRDAEQLLFQFHDALNEANNVLHALPDPDQVQCNPTTQARLAQANFDNPAIRNLSIIHGQDQFCSSSAIEIVLEDYKEHAIDSEYDLASIQHLDESADFLMVRHHGESKYIMSINPFMVNYLAEFACNNCLDYTFTIHGEPELIFSSTFQNTEQVIQYQVDKTEGSLKLSLVLHASQAFVNYYKELSWLTAVIFAGIVASLFSFVSYKLLSRRQSLPRLIQDALKYNEFTPFYQPIVDSRTGKLIGVEMLARWVKKDGTVIPPYQFIPYAEESGLIVDITEQILIKTAADIKRFGWSKGQVFTSINIVPEHLTDDRLFLFMQELIAKEQLQAHCFSLEITERRQIDDLENAKQILYPFYKLGMNLKLDDAGTGYGGFSYVQELGISTLKIDKMFVDTINRDDIKSQVLDAIINFANTSCLSTIAEGVESQAQVDYLANKGVYYIQGYVFAKPMNAEDMHTWQAQGR